MGLTLTHSERERDADPTKYFQMGHDFYHLYHGYNLKGKWKKSEREIEKWRHHQQNGWNESGFPAEWALMVVHKSFADAQYNIC